jgi:hypothetical protein
LQKQLQEALDALQDAGSNYGLTVREANEKISQLVEVINTAQETYNDSLNAVKNFVNDMVGDMESYYDEKSDKWKESDKGNEYSEWKSLWADLLDSENELDEVCIDEICEDVFDMEQLMLPDWEP